MRMRWSGNGLTNERSVPIIAAMATDGWTEQLRCPQCEKTGTVDLSQSHSDEIPTVLFLSDGFKAVATDYGPDFRCAMCNVAVVP